MHTPSSNLSRLHQRSRQTRRRMPPLAGAVLAVMILRLTTPILAQSPDTPQTGIVDRVGVVDPATQDKINACLLELEQKQLAMFKVLIIQTTGGRDPYTYTIETARQWKLGTRGKDNGLLMMVAVGDHRYRFVTGEGLEGAVPDLLTDSVGRQYMEPNFKKGDYAAGVYLAVVAIANRLAADAGLQLSTTDNAPGALPPTARGRPIPAQPVATGGSPGGSCCCVPLFPLIVFFLIFVAVLSSRRRRYYSTWGGGGFWNALIIGGMLSNLGGRGRSNWGSFGGGGFGGGGGGFGGGFGGSFGGGGSGGSW